MPPINSLEKHVLVVDDEQAICAAFDELLRADGYAVTTAATGQQAIEASQNSSFDAAFLDVRLPDMSGLEVMQHILSHQPNLPIIVMTAHGTVDTAMQAVQGGAFDYLGKPVDLANVRAILSRALQRNTTQAITAAPTTSKHELIGSSAVMQEIYKMMGLLADNDLSVLITGQSGVGKELVARGIHTHSNRADHPFMAVNCAAIPEQLLESELFGHEKGAFSGAHQQHIGRFEAAANGVLFLDEVFEMPLHLQGKLLRVLQERTFERVGSVTPQPLRARIIAATHRNLGADDEHVRADLFYRLSLVNINIPPLRERIGDIAELAQHFLAQANFELNKSILGLDKSAIAKLTAHTWPGNVRELDHTIKRSALVCQNNMLCAPDLLFEQSEPLDNQAHGTNQLDTVVRSALQDLIDNATTSQPFHDLITNIEQTLIKHALDTTQDNQVAASALLGINRTTLRNKLKDD